MSEETTTNQPGAMAPDLTHAIESLEAIVRANINKTLAVDLGDGEAYEESKAEEQARLQHLDCKTILFLLRMLDFISQPLPTLTTGKEVEQLEALSGRPIRVSAEFMAMLFRRALVARQLCSLPAGTYALRKKYALEDSWDAMVLTDSAIAVLGDHGVTEGAYSVEIDVAVTSLQRDADLIARGEKL